MIKIVHFIYRLAALTALLLISFFANSQNKTIRLSQPGPGGLLLNTGWRFHAGDNPLWANPGFNDNDWATVDPTSDIDQLKVLRDSGIGWFRLHLHLDTALLSRPVALTIRQIGASEIYINDSLYISLGKVSADKSKEVIYNPNNAPYFIVFKNTTEQTIAVRYSFAKGNLYFNNQGIGNPCLTITLLSAENIATNFIKDHSKFALLHFGKTGFLFFLGMLHLFFYFSYPAKKTNLFHALFAISFSLYYLLFFLARNLPREGSSYFIFDNLGLIFGCPGLFWAMTAVYTHSSIKRGVVYKLITVCLLLSFPLFYWPYNYGWILFFFSSLLTITEAIRISILAIRKKVTGAKIVLFGWLLFLLFIAVYFLTSFGLLHPEAIGFSPEIVNDLTYNLSIFCLSIPFSVILALDYAQTGRELQRELIQVEELTRKTIAQEKEKQEILSKQNEILELQVQDRTAALKQSLDDLRSTQAQLIQSEKMASLGELTAGIAHEIQNPLNFVNNFSDVNTELIEELKAERLKPKAERDEQLEDDILNDIKDNEQKINHHGKRADAIVKGMLQHSRSSTGVKEPTAINKLADEYLRLAYQGLRARDKEFNTNIKTEFDENIGNIDVVPQDIGRVLLNLFNNAFYAVNEKLKAESLKSEAAGSNYEPIVTVSTKKAGNKIFISVKDNGNGIPEKIKDKIFQPFFTTKPTGSGTGLGLSLSYDIIKAHGGEIKVETKEGEGSEFIIQLPV